MANSPRRNNLLKIAALAAIVALAVCVCGARGAGESLAGSAPPDEGPRSSSAAGWITLAEPVRVTFYGARYVTGAVTASGIRYAPDADIVALGPARLAAVREYYGAAAILLDTPLFAEWMPGPHLRYQGIAGGFPRHSCFGCDPEWWGFLVRVCALKSGAFTPTLSSSHAREEEVVRCEMLRVADTGLAGLDVDLPDETWLRFGYLAEQGVFTGMLQVVGVGR
jgi:hypothetical protein